MERGHGRFVPIDYHDECYRRLLDSVEMIEAETAADRLEVFNRGGVLILEHDFEPDGSPADARRTIENERARALSNTEITQYEQGWQRVFEYMNKRQAPAGQIESASKTAKAQIDELKTIGIVFE
jgi:hypothetical protein